MKKFFVPKDGKTTGLVIKNIIIFAVLLAVCGLSVWSWFTFNHEAVADGIYVKTKADGVKVSWDGFNYYDNLTAMSSSQVVKDTTGLAKNLGNPLTLDLITGNGLNFFEPVINRRTGQQLLNSDGSWKGEQITSANSAGHYVDIDLFFRGESEKDIYLAGDSKISPKNPNGNLSEYGSFSKDYISAASRVAFLDANKNNCSFIWAPNADIELREHDAGYQMYTNKITEEVTVSSGTIDIDGGVVNNNKTYYFWTFWDDSVVTASPQDLSKFEARRFEYDEDLRYFVTDVTMYIPTYGGDNPSIPIFINESSVKPSGSAVNQYNQYVDGAKSHNTLRDDLGQYYVVTNTSYNVGDAAFSNAMKVVNGKIAAGSRIDMKLGYDPYNKILVVLSYTSSDGGSFDLAGQNNSVTIEATYFPLANDTICTLVNPTGSVAVSVAGNHKKQVHFKNDSDKNTVLPLSITTSEQFVAKKTGSGYDATYKFKNNSNNLYLDISNGTVSFNSTGSDFTLYYLNGFDGPLLKAGDYFLAVENGVIKSLLIGYLEPSEVVTVYTGLSFELIQGLTTDNQPYQYYNYNSKNLVVLGSGSSPKLFTNTASTSSTTKIGATKIATLTKADESDQYYTAHIVMRVWVEGTDREAQTPLADGIFNMSLHFTSQ